ncbi:hypothetical protein RQP46_001645 [Phenoliferia psychrophenolica]
MAQVPATIPAFLHAAYIGLAPAEQQELASTYAPPPPPPAPPFESTDQVIARTLPTLMALIARGSATQVAELRDTLSGALQLAEAVAAAKARTPFPQFPNEILLGILSSIPPSERATLHACQLTSRTFREYSTPVLYEHLNISWIPTCGFPLIATLGSLPSLANLVKSVTVSFPRFAEAGQLARRREEIVARMWTARKQEWAERLRDCNPAEVEHWENEGGQEFDLYVDHIDDQIREDAENEAWSALTRTGNHEWLEQGPREDEGRWEGGELLEELLASLPNLRRLEFTNYDCGIPSLPHLTHLTLRNHNDTIFANPNPPRLPETPNVEELSVDGAFIIPADYRVPRLHTLRLGPNVHLPLLSQLLHISRSTIKTLQLSVDDTDSVKSLAETLPDLLTATPGLEVLFFSGHGVYSTPAESIDTFTLFPSYLAESSLRNVTLPFRPTPLLFTSLPTTIERVHLRDHVPEYNALESLDGLLVEKETLPSLVAFGMSVRWDYSDREHKSAHARLRAAMEQRVVQGRAMGIEIVVW